MSAMNPTGDEEIQGSTAVFSNDGELEVFEDLEGPAMDEADEEEILEEIIEEEELFEDDNEEEEMFEEIVEVVEESSEESEKEEEIQVELDNETGCEQGGFVDEDTGGEVVDRFDEYGHNETQGAREHESALTRGSVEQMSNPDVENQRGSFDEVAAEKGNMRKAVDPLPSIVKSSNARSPANRVDYEPEGFKPSEDKDRKKWCLIYIFCALFFCAAAIGIVIGATIDHGNNDGEPSDVSTDTPTSPPNPGSGSNSPTPSPTAFNPGLGTDSPTPPPTPGSPGTGTNSPTPLPTQSSETASPNPPSTTAAPVPPATVDITTELDPYIPGLCNLSVFAQPHILSQCSCTGEINVIASDIEQKYLELQESLIPQIFDAFSEPLNSCAPANQALLWLSSGNNRANGVLLQRFLLALVFFGLGGPIWSRDGGWITEVGECSWEGVTCDVQEAVVGINLDENNLSGQLLGELGKLENLATLSVASNALSGELPPLLFSAAGLTEINISGNSLSGPIPSEIGVLVNLRDLNFGGNALTGTPPTDLAGLVELTSLALNDNLLTGQLPTVVGNLAMLEYLDFSDNNFLSFIPRQYGTLTELKVYLLNRAGVTGAFPTEMANMMSLERLEMSDNRVRGEIPVSIASLPNLSTLKLNDNDMEGTIPTEFGLAVNLTVLALHQNELTGTVPVELSNLDKLESLTLEGNLLGGQVPDEVCALTAGGGVLGFFSTDCPDRETGAGVVCNCCAPCP